MADAISTFAKRLFHKHTHAAPARRPSGVSRFAPAFGSLAMGGGHGGRGQGPLAHPMLVRLHSQQLDAQIIQGSRKGFEDGVSHGREVARL
jgi:hypothetical protein